MPLQIFTIGVYGSTAEEFFKKLTDNKIDTFCDIRMRRAVRGAQYAFANSERLQKRLEELGIRYRHILSLAPTKEIIDIQDKADEQHHIARRKREELSPAFIKAYKNQRLSHFNPDEFVAGLPEGTSRIVLFCVEKSPQACHRSLVAEKLADKLDVKVKHL